MADTDAVVAIYWDFENVHACLIDDQTGEQTYRATAKYRAQDVVIDVARVAEYAAGHGRVAVHRAYANWQFFGKYAVHLQACAIDLVQLFPLTSSKNGADIRLALDVLDDLRLHPQITHVVVVGSDSDYTALAQRCRAYGVRFVGVGTARTAPSYPAACDEFVRYHELPPSPRFVPAPAPAPVPVSVTTASFNGAASMNGTASINGTASMNGAASLDGAADVVERAIRRVAADNGGSPWVLKAAVRPMVKRLDPGFEESALGFAAFSDLVKALGGRVAERIGMFDHELAVRADLPGGASVGGAPVGAAEAVPGNAVADGAEAVPAADLGPVAPNAPAAPNGSANPYGPADPFAPAGPAALIEGLLKRKKQRLPVDRQLLWTATGLIAEIFAAAPDGVVASFDRLRVELESAAAASGTTVLESDFRKLKAILWRAHAFEPLGYALGLRLREPDAAGLRLRAVVMLLRLLPDPAGADRSALAEAIFGPAFTSEQRDLISAALRKLAEHPEADADADEAESDAPDDEDDAADADAADHADADAADHAAGADDGDEVGFPAESVGWESAA